MMDGVNKGSFCGGIPGKEQGLSLKDYYLIKSQVMRRYRSNKLMEEYDENLLGGLRHDIDEMRQVLNCLRLPWMKLADAFPPCQCQYDCRETIYHTFFQVPDR